MDWRHRAVCREEDPELFFPIGNTGPALLQIEEAKAVCRRCFLCIALQKRPRAACHEEHLSTRQLDRSPTSWHRALAGLILPR